ncbi:MAG TPA: bifunctional demethylmenaquinone methyltransferase/2-methoxy-6-polyprenyl-1,4-benzoquinol methylase UbiE [Flavitalea sp.]|nr:bifunctional demethylmenaquinone methyltransferase/2-methoxy-6-polyprenyl-1,4-benzoquinol methylase UbiE [Flavitalea sp.]
MPTYSHDNIVPFKGSAQTKKQQVEGMFDKIAFRYDFLNRFLSGGIDVYWRKLLIKELVPGKPKDILDIATGTGDVAIMAYKRLRPCKITGIDISNGMLELGRKKIAKYSLQDHIRLYQGDSEAIQFPDSSFDAVTVAFGVRNFENLEKGLAEMYRVLRPGGTLAILEFSQPKNKLFRPFYNMYMKVVANRISAFFGSNRAAYEYLHASVEAFPEGKTLQRIIKQTGFENAFFRRLTLGICTIYCGKKQAAAREKDV